MGLNWLLKVEKLRVRILFQHQLEQRLPLKTYFIIPQLVSSILLKEKNVLPDIVFTSMLRRAINTANVALDEADRLWQSNTQTMESLVGLIKF